MSEIKIRTARPDEIDWANQRYEEVSFLPSDPAREVIAVAEVNGERAGLGRLVSLEGGFYDLGGIYVFEEFQRRGAARALVRFLLAQADPGRWIFCLPFAGLEAFYRSCGFAPLPPLITPPGPIQVKHDWCRQTYEEPVLLMATKRP